jgi:hypothetical protein
MPEAFPCNITWLANILIGYSETNTT